MTKYYPDHPNPVMIYNPQNHYAIVDASDLDAYLDAGWNATPLGDAHTDPVPFTGDLALPEADEANPLEGMTKAQLLEHAEDVHGLELSDKLTKEKIIEAISAATANL